MSLKIVSNLSFTSASTYPVKIFKDTELVRSLNEERTIIPRHVQLCPTNKCNLSCSFCSCRDRDKNLELSKQDVDDLLEVLNKVKTRGVTITGGGEPLLFEHIEYLIERLRHQNIEVGLTTNGVLFDRLNVQIINLCTWIRVSVSDYSTFDDNFIKGLDYALHAGSNVDFGFSYIATEKPDIPKIVRTIEYANSNNFTHVRLSNDIMSNSRSDLMVIKAELAKHNIDDGIVIYQSKEDADKGQKSCLISLLKPMISADGLIYPCCGVQYAKKNEIRDAPYAFNMGNFRDLPDIVEKQAHFNGSVCESCYYDTYNTYLRLMVADHKHLSFM